MAPPGSTISPAWWAISGHTREEMAPVPPYTHIAYTKKSCAHASPRPADGGRCPDSPSPPNSGEGAEGWWREWASPHGALPPRGAPANEPHGERRVHAATRAPPRRKPA